MTNEIKNLAQMLNLEINIDEIGNVCLRKKFGNQNINKGVVIQCHMDMVCTQINKPGFKFNFNNDSIVAFIKDNDWLKAEGTTLGADNGIGIAAGLALFEDLQSCNINQGFLELLITVDEETTMGGAINLVFSDF